MKKRCLVLSILLAFSMLLGACGSGDPFEGKWRGTLDVTKQFEDGIIAHYPDLEEYVDFEDLIFVIDVTFSDGMMSMFVDQASVEAFNQHFADGMMDVEEGSLMALLDAEGITLEEAVAESGMTEEEYIAYMLNSEEVTEIMIPMKENMMKVTEAALIGFEEVNGPYTFNDDTIKVHYEDATFEEEYEAGKYEAVEYSFEGDDLILVFRGEGFSLRIVCEEQ